MSVRTIAVIALAAALLVPASARAAGTAWLAVSDVHLDPYDGSGVPSTYGADTNLALLDSAIAEMKRAVPDPALVLLTGDFLAHRFAQRALSHGRAATPEDAGLAAMRLIAGRFAAAFPHARFALVLGNNDAPCGDYVSENGGPYLRALAKIWAPLVNRGGAAPAFESTFARGGYYTAALPANGMRLVAIDSVVFSREYLGSCAHAPHGTPESELQWISSTLAATPPGERNVVLMHIPPGYDVFATSMTRSLLAWPYYQEPANRSLLGLLQDPADRVAYAIAGHLHRFDFRLAGKVPVIVLGALSPVYENNPSFYALRVNAAGDLTDVDAYAYDEDGAAWSGPHGFRAAWHVASMNAAALAPLHDRLRDDVAARRAWGVQASGWTANPQDPWTGHWLLAWCAQTELDAGFAECAGIARRDRLAIPLAIAALAFAVLFVAGAVRLARRRLASRR